MNAPLTKESKFRHDNDPCTGCDLSCSGCAFTDEPLYIKIKLRELGYDTHGFGRRLRLEEDKKKIIQSLIPPGPYCYVMDFTKESESRNPEDGIPVVYCPFSKTKDINGVPVPWCTFLNKGGTSNDHTEEQWAKLVEYFGSDDNIFDRLPLDLLWDSCKECGEGGDYDYTKEQAIKWIKLTKEYES